MGQNRNGRAFVKTLWPVHLLVPQGGGFICVAPGVGCPAISSQANVDPPGVAAVPVLGETGTGTA